MELSKLDLSVKTFNSVCRAGIKTAEELLERYNDDYEKFSLLLGQRSTAEVGDALARHRAELTATEPAQSAVIVSEDYTRAVSLTRSIIANAQAAQQSLYEVCRGLKEIRDGKLYKELGYANFEEYTENEVGIHRHQAYKYVSIADMKNVDSNQHLGITKLYLLAKLDEPIRQEVTESVDLENVTVKELKAQIATLRAEKGQLEQRAGIAESQRDAAMREYNKAENERLQSAAREQKLSGQVQSLESQVKELESRPIDHAVQEVPDPEQQKRIAELEEQLLAAQIPADTTDIEITAKLEGLYNAFDTILDSIEDMLDDIEDAERSSELFTRLRDRIAQAERYVGR